MKMCVLNGLDHDVGNVINSELFIKPHYGWTHAYSADECFADRDYTMAGRMRIPPTSALLTRITLWLDACVFRRRVLCDRDYTMAGSCLMLLMHLCEQLTCASTSLFPGRCSGWSEVTVSQLDRPSLALVWN